MLNNPKFPLFFAFLTFLSFTTKAQKDTEFWFAAPEISNGYAGGDFDAPVRFLFSSYELGAIVTLSQPANPDFVPIVRTIPGNTSESFVFYASDLSFIENDQPNIVRNIGFKIVSTAPISVYYEVIGVNTNNPELYSLKGKNSLGTTFFIPFQTLLSNSTSYNPQPGSSFDIVATENNTVVTINPTRDIIGHSANTPFNITLNQGETFSSWSSGLNGSQHASGTKVSATKPIAITMKDDLLEGGPIFGGFCRDQLGDQLIPVDKIGTKYVVQRGLLNGAEMAFVVGTSDNTQIRVNGTFFDNVNECETKLITIDELQFFIETTAPVYVLQMTGRGCEVAGEVLPPLDCTGSNSVRFVRSNNEPFFLFVVTKAGNEGGFKLNGNANSIPSTIFNTIPGSNGEFVGAVTEFSDTEVIPEQSSFVENSMGVFQMGFLNGGTVTGCRFGFFSDYGNKTTLKDSIELCLGETSEWRGITVFAENTYLDTSTNITGCDTIFELKVKSKALLSLQKEILLCVGESINLNGIIYTAPNVVFDTLEALLLGCDTLLTINLKLKAINYQVKNIELCPNSTFNYLGIEYNAPFIIIDTIQSLTSCDTILTINLLANSFITKNEFVEICPNATYIYNGIEYSAPNVIFDTLMAINACDTIIKIEIVQSNLPFIVRQIDICPYEKVSIGGQEYNQEGVISDTIKGVFGCDTIRNNVIQLKELPKPFLYRDTSICDNEKINLISIYQNTTWNNSVSSQSFEVSDTGNILIKMTNDVGCSRTDSLRVNTCCFDKKVKIPNAFTPNNDGLNDYFKPLASESCNSFEFSIYNRWGQLIFTGTEIGNGWDGTFKGKNVPIDVYIWVLKSKTKGIAEDTVEKGDVTVIR
jgi:gliding motility-associated-like protein